MVKIELKKHEINCNLLSPLPVILVGALVKGRPNFLVIGYSCPFDFGSIFSSVCLKLVIHELEFIRIKLLV